MKDIDVKGLKVKLVVVNRDKVHLRCFNLTYIQHCTNKKLILYSGGSWPRLTNNECQI